MSEGQAIISWPEASIPQDAIALFDVHVHYNASVRPKLDPAAAISLLKLSGIGNAIVSSAPDEATERLVEAAPDMIFPFLRPYRNVADAHTWTSDPSIVTYVRRRLVVGPAYRGIGEFRLLAGAAVRPVVHDLLSIAGEHDLVVHVHGSTTAVGELLQAREGLRVLWAHAGVNARPFEVVRLLDRHPLLWADIALRRLVDRRGRLDPAWGDAFQAFPDRFLYGSDTWNLARWETLPRQAAVAQSWLRQLPALLSHQIASENAARLLAPGRR